MDSRFTKIVSMAEKLGWVVYDYQPENCLMSFVKESLPNIRINIWCGRKGTTAGLQYKLSKTTKHMYFHRVNDGVLNKIFKENLSLIKSLYGTK